MTENDNVEVVEVPADDAEKFPASYGEVTYGGVTFDFDEKLSGLSMKELVVYHNQIAKAHTTEENPIPRVRSASFENEEHAKAAVHGLLIKYADTPEARKFTGIDDEPAEPKKPRAKAAPKLDENGNPIEKKTRTQVRNTWSTTNADKKIVTLREYKPREGHKNHKMWLTVLPGIEANHTIGEIFANIDEMHRPMINEFLNWLCSQDVLKVE